MKTFYGALRLFDCISSQYPIPKSELMVCSVLIFDLVSKMSENRTHYFDFIKHSQNLHSLHPFNTRSKKDLANFQRKLMVFFNFEFRVPTVFDFVLLFFEECPDLKNIQTSACYLKQIDFSNHLMNLLESVSQTYESNRFSCMGLACGIVFILRSLLGFKEAWPQSLISLAGVKSSDLAQVCDFVMGCYDPSSPKVLIFELETSASDSETTPL